MGTLGRPAARAPINTGDIPDNIITSAKIAADVLTAADIAPNAVTTSELANDAVETLNIKDSTGASDGITAAKIATSAVTNAKLSLDYTDATYRAPTIDNSFAAATKTIKKIDATTYYSVNDILVFLNGVCLIPTTDYTVNSSGTATLTLVEGAPATASSLVVRYLAL